MTALDDVLADLEASPTPYHAVARAADVLGRSGFREVDQRARLPTGPGRHLVVEGGALVAWVQAEPLPAGFVVVAAHTDSPGLRVKSHPDLGAAGAQQVGVEVYGGPLLNSWLDRDLGLAGRVAVRTGGRVELRLVRDDAPVLRVPQLAIHLDREVATTGLRLDPQLHLTPMWGLGAPGPGLLAEHVAGLLDVAPEAVLAWDLMAFDTQPPALVGRDRDLIASARIDDQLSVFCGAHALGAVAGAAHPRTPVLALYDHEEVGSESATGAAGALLGQVLERISLAGGRDREGHLAALASSVVVSADGAHATHPNHPDRHDPAHRIALNAGIVVKRNAKQRYATDAISEGWLRAVAADAGLPLQTYVHRNDLPCGSTVGPITAAALGVPTVDVGAPQLAMHSIRETAGARDVEHLVRLLSACWTSG